MPPFMTPTRKFKVIEEMLDMARKTGRFEAAHKLQRALLIREDRML